MKVNDFFRQYGIRKTCPRSEVLKAIRSMTAHHFSVEDVLMRLKSTARAISRASAYRSINLFAAKGFLRATDLAEHVQVYELVRPGEHHDHLCCSACGAIIEFTHSGLEALQEKVCRSRGFKPASHLLRIWGLCRKCKKRTRKP